MDVLKCRTWLVYFLLAAVISFGHTNSVWGQTPVEIVTEPGFVADDGSWVLPYRLKPAGAGDIKLIAQLNDQPLPVHSRLRYAFGTASEAETALVITFDLPRLDPDVSSRWAADLVVLADQEASPGLKLALRSCRPDEMRNDAPGSTPIGMDEIEASLRFSEGQLWDGVISSINALTVKALPGRRVVLLVSDGREEIASRHVMTSCVEAALRARVSVFVLSLAGDDEAATARLSDLARRTGGQLMLAPVPKADDLGKILGDIGAARGLKFDPTALEIGRASCRERV